jgi:hypothetical protein
MPETTDEDLARLIKEGEILFLSVDTSVIDQKQHSYHNEPLRSLKQFSDSRYSLVMSSTVLSEVTNHFRKRVLLASSNLEKAIKETLGPFEITDRPASELLKLVIGERDLDQFSEGKVQSFFQDCGTTVINDASVAPVADLISRYFSQMPPFSAKKKSEFPDAIALLALEQYAKSERQECIVVSTDDDWEEFCKSSDYLYYHRDLVKVLSWLDRPDTGFFKFWASVNEDDEAYEVYEELLEEAKDTALGTDVEFDVIPDFNGRIEISFWTTDIQEIDFSPDSTALIINQTDAGRRFVVNFSVKSVIRWEVTLEYLIWDSVDGEEININTTEEAIERPIDFSITATFEKDQEKFKIVDISRPTLHEYINLGAREVF